MKRLGRRGRVLGITDMEEEFLDDSVQKNLLEAAGIGADVLADMPKEERKGTLKAILESNPSLLDIYSRKIGKDGTIDQTIETKSNKSSTSGKSLLKVKDQMLKLCVGESKAILFETLKTVPGAAKEKCPHSVPDSDTDMDDEAHEEPDSKKDVAPDISSGRNEIKLGKASYTGSDQVALNSFSQQAGKRDSMSLAFIRRNTKEAKTEDEDSFSGHEKASVTLVLDSEEEEEEEEKREELAEPIMQEDEVLVTNTKLLEDTIPDSQSDVVSEGNESDAPSDMVRDKKTDERESVKIITLNHKKQQVADGIPIVKRRPSALTKGVHQPCFYAPDYVKDPVCYSQVIKLMFDIYFRRLHRAQMSMTGNLRNWGKPVCAGSHVDGCLTAKPAKYDAELDGAREEKNARALRSGRQLVVTGVSLRNARNLKAVNDNDEDEFETVTSELHQRPFRLIQPSESKRVAETGEMRPPGDKDPQLCLNKRQDRNTVTNTSDKDNAKKLFSEQEISDEEDGHASGDDDDADDWVPKKEKIFGVKDQQTLRKNERKRKLIFTKDVERPSRKESLWSAKVMNLMEKVKKSDSEEEMMSFVKKTKQANDVLQDNKTTVSRCDTTQAVNSQKSQKYRWSEDDEEFDNETVSAFGETSLSKSDFFSFPRTASQDGREKNRRYIAVAQNCDSNNGPMSPVLGPQDKSDGEESVTEDDANVKVTSSTDSTIQSNRERVILERKRSDISSSQSSESLLDMHGNLFSTQLHTPKTESKEETFSATSRLESKINQDKNKKSQQAYELGSITSTFCKITGKLRSNKVSIGEKAESCDFENVGVDAADLVRQTSPRILKHQSQIHKGKKKEQNAADHVRQASPRTLRHQSQTDKGKEREQNEMADAIINTNAEQKDEETRENHRRVTEDRGSINNAEQIDYCGQERSKNPLLISSGDSEVSDAARSVKTPKNEKYTLLSARHGFVWKDTTKEVSEKSALQRKRKMEEPGSLSEGNEGIKKRRPRGKKDRRQLGRNGGRRRGSSDAEEQVSVSIDVSDASSDESATLAKEVVRNILQQSSKRQQKNPAEGGSSDKAMPKGTCPICGELFIQSELEVHASTCGEGPATERGENRPDRCIYCNVEVSAELIRDHQTHCLKRDEQPPKRVTRSCKGQQQEKG